jgi:methylated-DNA-[protein]-cysteine S-methyltransferase
MDLTLVSTYIDSPLGMMRISGHALGITEVLFCDDVELTVPTTPVPDCLLACVQQVQEYFAGTRQTFDLVLAPKGTPFQQQVWESLQGIPFGKSRSYMEVARAVSGEKAIRAVGAANGRNPICLVVPCHRVIGSDGSLIGYAGGLWRKEWLLRHEGILKASPQFSLF